MNNGLIDPGRAKDLVLSRPPDLELVLTGRDAPAEYIELADLATEMKNIKHPLRKGVTARRGIER